MSRQSKPRSRQPNQRNERPKPPTSVMLYGVHPVVEALKNPNRRSKNLFLDQSRHYDLLRMFQPLLDDHPNPPALQWTSRDHIEQTTTEALGQPVPHQGVMLRCGTLPELPENRLFDYENGTVLVALDQVNDPHNVGAIIRTAAAFDAGALITTDRHTPFESGLLAKTASGGLDRLPWARVKNLGNCLEALKDHGFIIIGFDGNSETHLDQIPITIDDRVVMVMGAESKGLRERTQELLDHSIRLPTADDFPHLNVSNAAAIALYALKTRG